VILCVTRQVVSGPAIPVPTPSVIGGPVDDALVQEYLEKYIAALRQLYEKHKVAAGCGSRTLEIL
jgi:hypothetical protein